MFRFNGIPYLSRYGFSQLVILFCLLGQANVYAEEAPAYGVILQKSLTQAPILLEQAANVRAADAEVQQAKVYLNPSVSGVAENLSANSANPRQNTFMLTQPIDIGGKRSARIDARTRDLEVAEAYDRQIQIIYAAELATAYANAEAMANKVTISKEDLARANDDFNAAKALVDAGREAQLRVSQAQASVSSAQAISESSQANLVEALERLSVLAGAESAYSSVDGNFTEQAIAMMRTSYSQTSVSPAIARAQAEREAYEAQVRVEERKWIPDVGLSAGIRRFEGSSDNAFVVGISSDIPVFDQNRGGIAAAKERVNAAEARLEATKLDANAKQRTAIAQVTASQKRLEAARQGEAAASEAYRLGRIGYESGKTSLIELLLIRKSLTDARLMTTDARASLVQALAALAVTEGRVAFGEMK